MAESETETQGQPAEAEALSADAFGDLLRKEFRPKSDRAREEVETAVKTLAEQALQETTVISDDVVSTINAIIAEIDQKLTDQVNEIIHNEKFQNVEAAYDRVMRFVARFMGANEDEISFTLNRDFFDSRLSPQEIMAIIQLGDARLAAVTDQREMLRTGRIGLDPERTNDEIDTDLADASPL